jgi:predicted nucleic acid-binding protein
VSGYLLDTSALSAYLNEEHPHHEVAISVIGGLSTEAAKLVSVVTLAELHYGIRFAELQGSRRLAEYRKRLDVVRQYASLDLTRHTSEVYAELKVRLAGQMQRKTGKKMLRWIEDWIEVGSAKRLQIDENDLWICAQAKERDLIVVTGDVDIRQLSSFDPDLKILLTRK